MDIMEDVLDLIDSVGDRLKKRRQAARRVLRGEAGFSTLVIVLVIMALGAIIITPLLVYVVTGQKAGKTHNDVTLRNYAADSGIQDGVWRVNSGNLPDWMKGSFGAAEYDHVPYSYSLPDLVNSCNVSVEIRPQWLLEGLEDPVLGRDPSTELDTVCNITGAGHLEVVIVATDPGSFQLNRIGVWLPKGFTYTAGSSNLETLAESSPAHCHPTVSDWKGGHTVIFDYASYVNFSSFPTEASDRIVITLDYTPSTAMTGGWSWCRTNHSGSLLSYSSDIKLYQVTTTATDQNGHSTTIIAGSTTNESMGTYLAYYGDYTVTGNAILRDQDGEGHYRERAYLESPGTVSGIPGSGKVDALLLYWSGWKSYPNNVWYESSSDISTWSQANRDTLNTLAPNYRVDRVSLKVIYNSHTYDLGTVYAQAGDYVVLPNGSHSSPNGWSYGCHADITQLVKDALASETPAFVGNAKYVVGHAALGTSAPSDKTIQGIWGSSATDIFVVGDSGTIVHYDGSSWAVQPSGVTNYLYGVWGTAANNVFAVGASGRILSYNGTSWSTMTSGTTNSLNGVWGSAANNVFAVGASSTIRKYTTSWGAQTRSDSRTETLRGVWGSSGTDVWIVGDRYSRSSQNRYTLLHTTNGGTNWTNVGDSMTNGQNLYSVWGAAYNDIWAVGANGRILYYNGTSWSTQNSGTTQTLYGVWGSSATDVFAVGANGTILHSSNRGATWSTMTSGTTYVLYGAWGSSGTNVYAVGQSTGAASTLLHYNGTGWSPVAAKYSLYSWVDGHSGETVVGGTDYPLGDTVNNEWQNAAWSVITLYNSPVTLAHQMYLFDTFRYWNGNDDKTFTIDGFLAPAGVSYETAAVRLTCFVGEGDSIYSGDNVYLNGHQLNNGAAGIWNASNNCMNGVSNSGGNPGYPPDCIDLDTYTVNGSSGYIEPADSSALVRMKTGTDVWNLVYMVLSFRSDIVGGGLVSYIIL